VVTPSAPPTSPTPGVVEDQTSWLEYLGESERKKAEEIPNK